MKSKTIDNKQWKLLIIAMLEWLRLFSFSYVDKHKTKVFIQYNVSHKSQWCGACMIQPKMV